MATPSRENAFDLYYQHGWIYLTAYPTGEQGRTVYPEEVENRMRLLGMPRVRSSRIREIIEAGRGTPEPLTEWPEGERLTSKITVEIAEDEMSATVTVTPPRKGAAPPILEDVQGALDRAGVTFGVEEGAINQLLDTPRYNTPITAARGREPVLGKSRKVEYLFELNRGKPYLEMEFGRIDLKELNFIDNRKKGDLLARLLPPVEAVDGRTVTGRVIPAERDDRVAEIPGGENTHLSASGEELYASIDGNVRFREGKVIVEPVVEVQNVNYETGNIHFDGSVVIEGVVADGFFVEASGNIQVGRGVGKATLKAGENVLLQTGMNGNGEGRIDCGGNLFARYLESCTVRCGGNAFVEEAIMHSEVTVWKNCILNGRRAECIAGDVIVGRAFWCKKLGNVYEAASRITVGIAPDLLLEYRNAWEGVRKGERELNTLEEQLDRLETAIREGHREEKFLSAREQLQGQRSALEAELRELRKDLPLLRERLQPLRGSVVVVEEVIYRGAVVSFGRQEYRAPEKGARKTVLRPGRERVQESGFDYHNPPKIEFEAPSSGEERTNNG
ncbi:MAG: FapA family protein [Spirochaetaceae bacterium]